MASKYLLNRIPQAIEYISLPAFKMAIFNRDKILQVLEKILPKLQGQPVEFQENNSASVLMLVFFHLRKFCPEIVFKAEKLGQRILIFDNQAVPVLRPHDVISLKENENTFSKAKVIPSLKINLEQIWLANKQPDPITSLENCLREIKAELKPTKSLVLIGQKPAILFLLAQNLALGLANEIYYQSAIDSKYIKIK